MTQSSIAGYAQPVSCLPEHHSLGLTLQHMQIQQEHLWGFSSGCMLQHQLVTGSQDPSRNLKPRMSQGQKRTNRGAQVEDFGGIWPGGS